MSILQIGRGDEDAREDLLSESRTYRDLGMCRGCQFGHCRRNGNLMFRFVILKSAVWLNGLFEYD